MRNLILILMLLVAVSCTEKTNPDDKIDRVETNKAIKPNETND